jgi:hypothetical protein
MFPSRSLFICSLMTMLASCASSNKYEIEKIEERDLVESSVNITYQTGHKIYSFKAWSVENNAQMANYLNNQLIEEKEISYEQYLDFSNQALELAKSHPEFAEEEKTDELCKMPFSIEIKTPDRIKNLMGCRSDDEEGRLGRLIRTGEILFYK